MATNRTGVHLLNLARRLPSNVEVEWPEHVAIYHDGLPLALMARLEGEGYSFVVPDDFDERLYEPIPTFTDLNAETADGKRKFLLQSINLKSAS